MSDNDITEVQRKARLIRQTVAELQLDLGGLSIFTEAATGSFSVTAPIAAFAGAEKVYAIGRDSRYGTREEAFAATRLVAESLGVESRINFIDKRETDAIAESDIVTNTGFVRPIDEPFVQLMEGSGVVSLMYEPWEHRGEVDVEACWESDIPVVGTDESDPRVRTQEYVGLLPVKLSLTNDIEVMGNSYLVVGGGRMAKHSAEKLRVLGANVRRIDPDETSDLPADVDISKLDAVVVVDHRIDKELLGADSFIEVDDLEQQGSGVTIIHICGPTNQELLTESTIKTVPEHPADPGHMSYTTGDLGPTPVIKLHTAGLAAGEVAVRTQATGAGLQESVDAAVSEGLGADFDTEFKRVHGHPGYTS